jgi:putative Mg2+ transporter-C (MgtC) family protein
MGRYVGDGHRRPPEALTHVQIEVAVRITVAAVAGMAIGIERELREQAAGLRTHILVSVGSCLFTLVSIYGFTAYGGTKLTDPSRVAAQIVTGIGFLGAGAILRQGANIRGLTTAASLWIAAAIGMAVGVGMYWGTGVAVFITLIGLWALRPVRRRLRMYREEHEEGEPPE